MSNQIMQVSGGELLESVVIGGDLKNLSPAERVNYYKAVCTSLGLNPLTKPFDYITLNGKLTLYARKDAADQLRKLHSVSITKLEREKIDTIYTVTAYAQDLTGRQDSSIGAVNIENLKGDNLANAIMKAETKAKRRVTLSLCGLGMLDETEIETIKDAAPAIIEEMPALSIEEAMGFTTKDGRKFGDLDFEELRGMLAKGLEVANPNAGLQRKIEAINLLLSQAEAA